MPDPIDNLLEDLGRARGRVKTDLVRLPAVDPLIYLLDEVDSILSRVETDIREAKNVAMAPLRAFESLKIGQLLPPTVTGPASLRRWAAGR